MPAMSTGPIFASDRGMGRAARGWLLWLALALAAAHSMATWHAYTHSPAEAAQSSSTEKHAGSAVCGLCIAVAGIGGAAPGHSSIAMPVADGQAPLPVAHVARHPSLQHRPYAIRAPPLTHS